MKAATMLVALFLFFVSAVLTESNYMIGVGRFDVTGSAAEVNMMGYAMPAQTANGIHLRQWSRAYIFVDKTTGNRVVFVNNDLCMIMQSVKLTVIARLQALYGDMYTHDNVMLSGIHTHSGPGGYSWYALYDITSLGFVPETFDVTVDGIVQAIVIAHNNIKDAQASFDVGRVEQANINRSPSAYLNNPQEERDLYPDGDTDKTMTLMKIVDSNNVDMGAIAWFAVHCTSMNNSNHLISSDNKGYASYLFEREMSKVPNTPFNQIPFVASFGQSNEGDVSPNTRGAFCPDGTPCSLGHSTCNGKTETCIAHGPGRDMFESTAIIASYQFKEALSLYQTAKTPLSGPIMFRHMFINMTDISVSPNFTATGKPGKTCRAAMGYSFAAGTTDGPGAFDFTQGNNKSANPFWNFISGFVSKPDPEQIECQLPKPILIDVGTHKPFPWTPEVVPVQIFAIGQLVILGVPGEFTTMAGRRLRNTVQKVLEDLGMENPTVIVAGLSNTYTGYISTFEEYEVQRYEGASTIFGPHTHAAYVQAFAFMATAMMKNTTVPAGPTPQNMSNHQLTFLPPVILDTHPLGKSFGSMYQDVPPNKTYQAGVDQVEVVFYGANPRNNHMTMSSFLYIEQLVNGVWVQILSDADWDTKFTWKMHELSESLITITWDIAGNTQAGQYRITHQGYAKTNPLNHNTEFYQGNSGVFTVSN